MTFDGITARAVVDELNQKIVGGHVKKINQIGPAQLTLAVYAHGENRLLYLSSDASSGRFHLTQKKYSNPTTPPNFLMLVRKHIGQGKITSIEQMGLDRTIRFTFQTRNELGDLVDKHIVLELMGRHSNLILLDEHDRVLDAMRRVSHDMSRVRQIYPGQPYTLFASQKKDVLTEDVHVDALIRSATSHEGGYEVRRLFYGQLTGFSPLASTELCVRADVAPDTPIGALTAQEVDALDRVLQDGIQALRENAYDPHLYASPKVQAYPFALTHYEAPVAADRSMSALIDRQTQETARDDRLGQEKNRLAQLVAQALEHRHRKWENLKKDFEDTEDRFAVKEEADLLAANAHAIERGQSEVVVSDFYHDGQPRRIVLDVRKSGHENMDFKYKLFAKKNTAHRLLSAHIPALEQEIVYLESLSDLIDRAADMEDIEALEAELVREKLVRRPQKQRKKAKTQGTLEPRVFETAGGFTVYVGRNNLQNDRLTLKVADGEDIFLHAKTVPGAHVILRTGRKKPPQEDLEAAAWLAAHFSSRAKEHTVDIDYTERKNVYKAKGAKPGMVYYNDYKTITVNTEARPALRQKED
ncbi:MAG: NFACT RNA binding domain-containing protein [Peptoniphilaceae bacterium]|nr:NFACT RNA binding domain-containing protein [Peptoniphilaceae bacterium]MDY6085597.1 NFACT RNA binding domain-containing protein [Peptoniphilaceae bacterium]